MFLSYIIPCYRSAKWLWQAVASCYRQDPPGDWEIVMCDDCSGDGTWEMMCAMRSQDPDRIKLIRHEQNLGQNPSKIDCIHASNGDWIFPLDHDNMLSDGLIERLWAGRDDAYAMSPEKLSFFGVSGTLRIHDSWSFDWIGGWCDMSHIVKSFKTPASGGNYLFSRSMYVATGGYLDHGSDLHGDWGFALNHTAVGHSIRIVPGTHYYHRYNPDGMYIGIAKDREKMARLKQQYKDLMLRHINRFDHRSQQLLRSNRDGHTLISSGELRLA